MTGRIKREFHSANKNIGQILMVPTSTRVKIRECDDGYNASGDYWLRCLYEDEKGDPLDVEKGFLKSNLLLKVRVTPFMLSCGMSY